MLKRIDPKEIGQNVFSLIGEQWMLITAGTAERCNTCLLYTSPSPRD